MKPILLFLLLVTAASCTQRNPAVCCVTEDNCSRVGLPFPSPCSNGLACDELTCIEPICKRQGDCVDPTLSYCVEGICVACDSEGDLGCDPAVPVCDPVTATCSACHSAEDCTSHPGTPICDRGSCVACMGAEDCGNSTPVCDDGGCRACRDDTECSSGACTPAGACADESKIVYVAPTGADGGVCSKTMPCATLYYALAQTTDTRQDVVMRPGTYPIPRTFDARSIVNGRAIHVHGYGAVLQPQFVVAPDPYWMLAVNAGTLRVSGVVVEHLASSASGPIFSCKNNGELILRDVRATSPVPSLEGESCSISIVSSSLKSTSAPYSVSLRGNQLEVSRSTIVGGLRTIHGNVTLSNNLFTGRGLSFGPGQGIVSFNTIADTTLPSGNARAIECENPLSRPEIFFNVIWSPIGTATSMVANCAPRDNLVGPLQQSGSGNINEDPRFLGPGNYHLAPTSPARDRATTGPAVDWDGESRPQGAGFDLGYDEITQ